MGQGIGATLWKSKRLRAPLGSRKTVRKTIGAELNIGRTMQGRKGRGEKLGSNRHVVGDAKVAKVELRKAFIGAGTLHSTIWPGRMSRGQRVKEGRAGGEEGVRDALDAAEW